MSSTYSAKYRSSPVAAKGAAGDRNLGTPINVAPGAILTDEKEVGSEFFLLLDGQAVCKVRGKTKAIRKTGDYFGELSLLDGGPRTATITAAEDCHLLVFDRKEFGRSCVALPLLQSNSFQTCRCGCENRRRRQALTEPNSRLASAARAARSNDFRPGTAIRAWNGAGSPHIPQREESATKGQPALYEV